MKKNEPVAKKLKVPGVAVECDGLQPVVAWLHREAMANGGEQRGLDG